MIVVMVSIIAFSGVEVKVKFDLLDLGKGQRFLAIFLKIEYNVFNILFNRGL